MVELSNYPDAEIIEQFLNRYENIKSRDRYQATVYHFISKLSLNRISDIQKDKIINYFELIKDNAARVSHTKEFLKYLISKELLNKEIVYDGKFIEKLYNFRPLQKNPGRTAIKYPLNVIIQIDHDIKTNYKNPSEENKWDYERKIKIAFFWELLFDAGYTVTDIKALKARFFTDRKEYIESGRKNQIVEDYYAEQSNTVKNIVNDYYNTLFLKLDKKKRKDGFSSLLCLETYNNDELEVYSLLAQDIKEARNRFYLKCPNCGTELKTIPDNWVFIKYKDNDEKFLACILCKGMIKNG